MCLNQPLRVPPNLLLDHIAALNPHVQAIPGLSFKRDIYLELSHLLVYLALFDSRVLLSNLLQVKTLLDLIGMRLPI